MIVNGYIDWAIRRDGPANKVYAEQNKRQGLVLHSMEGWLAGSFAELDKPSRNASWTFSLALTGELYQHYPITASTWASGNMEANTRYNSLELEGLYTMPINAEQIATLTRLCGELGYGREQLHEHRHVWNMATPNSGPTACPSWRYAPFYAIEEEEEEMTDEQFAEKWSTLMGQLFPVYLRLAFEEVDGKFSDRPDIPMTFPYKPWLNDVAARVRTIPGVSHDG